MSHKKLKHDYFKWAVRVSPEESQRFIDLISSPQLEEFFRYCRPAPNIEAFEAAQHKARLGSRATKEVNILMFMVLCHSLLRSTSLSFRTRAP